jgi:hypothetical protein
VGDIYNSLTLHRYVYCLNDPVNLVDPSGQVWSWAAVGVGTLIGGIAGTFYGLGTQTASAIRGGSFDWAAVGRAAAGGAVIGAFTGAVAGIFTADPSAAVLFGGSVAATGTIATGGPFLGGLTEGLLTPMPLGPVPSPESPTPPPAVPPPAPSK